MATDTLLPAPELAAWAARVFERASVPAADAATAADVLVSANVRGVDTHGIVRLPIYTRRLLSGAENPRPAIRVEREGPATALVDGDNGLGLVVAAWSMREAIRRATEQGAAVVTVRHSNHLGAAGYYAQMASKAGMIGISATNSAPAMAPWGGITTFLGTNPLAFAAPGGIEGGLVLDMATSQVAWGKVMLAARAGKSIPLSWATDQTGTPTDDPAVALKGMMLPLGGYKGYGLAMLVEVLCAMLSGANFGPGVAKEIDQPYRSQQLGHCLIAVDVRRFMPLEQFQASMQQLVEQIHASELAPGSDRIRVPGEIELETAAIRSRDGVPLPDNVIADLSALGTSVGEPFPWAV
jgi:LDH2 family malate/lactate/ureidoglycolate dehydrogenase